MAVDTHRVIIASKQGDDGQRVIVLWFLWPLALLGTGACLTFSISRGDYVSSFHSRNIYQIFPSSSLEIPLLPPRFVKISLTRWKDTKNFFLPLLFPYSEKKSRFEYIVEEFKVLMNLTKRDAISLNLNFNSIVTFLFIPVSLNI